MIRSSTGFFAITLLTIENTGMHIAQVFTLIAMILCIASFGSSILLMATHRHQHDAAASEAVSLPPSFTFLIFAKFDLTSLRFTDELPRACFPQQIRSPTSGNPLRPPRNMFHMVHHLPPLFHAPHILLRFFPPHHPLCGFMDLYPLFGVRVWSRLEVLQGHGDDYANFGFWWVCADAEGGDEESE